MTTLKNTWTAEEGEEIMNSIMNGDSVEVAKAKVMIKKDNETAKQMAAIWVSNIMAEDNELSRKYKSLSEVFVSNRKVMIDMFGHNFSAYNISGKKNQLIALTTGKNKNSNTGFKLQNSKGNGYGNL